MLLGLTKKSHIALPVRDHLAPKLEEYFLPEKSFDVETGRRTDLLDLLAALADHDRLLGIPLDHDRGVNACDLFFLVEFIDPHRAVIRKFFAQKVIELFADHFLHMKTHILIGELVLGINKFALRKIGQRLLDQSLDVLPGLGANGNEFFKSKGLLIGIQGEQEIVLGKTVDLVTKRNTGMETS